MFMIEQKMFMNEKKVFMTEQRNVHDWTKKFSWLNKKMVMIGQKIIMKTTYRIALTFRFDYQGNFFNFVWQHILNSFQETFSS